MKDQTPPPFETHSPPPARPKLRFNWEDWLPYLDEVDAPLDRKRELIETLWSIVLSFLDLGYEIDFGEETSGQSFDLAAVLRAAVLNSKDVAQSHETAQAPATGGAHE